MLEELIFAHIRLAGDYTSTAERMARYKADGMMCTIPIAHSAQRVPPYPLSPVLILHAISKHYRQTDAWDAILPDLQCLDPEAYKLFQPWLALKHTDPIPDSPLMSTWLLDFNVLVDNSLDFSDMSR